MEQDLNDLKIKYLQNLLKRKVLEEEARHLACEIIPEDIKNLIDEIWENEDKSLDWLIRPHNELNGRSPIETILNNETHRVRTILNAIRYGILS